MELARWDEVAIALVDGGWVEMPPNGWGALTAWCAGATNVRRVGLTVSDTDAAEIEVHVNEYLNDADIPARPSGYLWFVRCPPLIDSDNFWPTINVRAGNLVSDAPRPDEWRRALTIVLSDLYSAE